MTEIEMYEKLKIAFPGDTIEVLDLTGTEDHYEVFVQSPLFSGLSRIEQHQKVMQVFNDELKTGELHALSIKTKIKE
jgi:stress-induced morphogen